MALGGTFAALGNRRFLILWTGTFLAFIAFFMSGAVQNVVAFDLTGKNGAVGFVVFAQGVAQLALGPFGGALADRMSKRLLILTCQVIITLSFVAMAVLLSTDEMTIAYLAGGSFAIGLAFSFLGPARQGLMVELVQPVQRGNAIALSQVALNASRIIGPAFAALFLAADAIGPEGAFASMTMLYLFAIVTTLLMPGTKPREGPGRNVFAEIGSGLAYVARTPRIRSLVPSYILIIMAGFPYISVLPGLLENELDREPDQITILLVVNAIGGLIASLGVASLADSPRAARVYGSMCALFGLALVASGLAPSYWLLASAMFFVGAGAGGFQTLNGALISHLTDPAYFGRVMSLTFLAFAISSIVALPVGLLADSIGERVTIVASGLAVLALVLLFQSGAVLGWLRGREAGATVERQPESGGR
jgi:MFS family permease